jgi:phospholipase/carboxylesterase
VLLVHGTDDPVVPYDSLANAEAALKENDVPVETLSCPGMGHSIDQDGLTRAARFLVPRLNPS